MPVRPTRHKAFSSITKKHNQPTQRGRYGKGRGGRPWERKRERIFERDNFICQMCKSEGKLKAVELHGPNHGICDHIIPMSKGGTSDESNLQTLCQECDSIKSEKEANTNQHGAVLPQWMPRPVKPLVVVCGPPRAGKNTYITEHADPNDLILDLDMLAQEKGIARERNRSKAEINTLIRERNSRLADFCRGKTEHPKCWMISTAGSFRQRKFWRELGAELVVINPGVTICKQRIMEDTRKEEYVKQIRMRAVDNWK